MGHDPKEKQDVDELSADDLESVSGGAGADYLLELGDIKGESQSRTKVLLTHSTNQIKQR